MTMLHSISLKNTKKSSEKICFYTEMLKDLKRWSMHVGPVHSNITVAAVYSTTVRRLKKW